ncbi:MAG: hypothetical protein GY787_20135, partial [Alteromonadales bacterium]|nr:hypothetical protein [Alteromonadales bacterium]
MHTFIKFFSIIWVSALLTACGEESTPESPTETKIAPIAAVGADFGVDENTTATLDGNSSSDSDGSIVEYLWKQDSGSFNVELTSADQAVATFIAPDVDTDTQLVFELTVTDNDNISSKDYVTVTIFRVNQQPIANAPASLEVAGNEMVTIDGGNSIDHDGSITSYSWTQTSGTNVTILNANEAVASFTAPNINTQLGFQLTVADNEAATNSNTLTVTVNEVVTVPVNQAPTANAGVDLNIDETNTVVLDGIASTDSDGNIVSYSWEQLSGVQIIISNANQAVATFSAPEVDIDTQLIFRLTVIDDDEEDAVDNVTVIINDIPEDNQAPTVDAGQNQSVLEQSDVSLNATYSDTDGYVVSGSWTQTGGTPVTIQNANTANAMFTAPALNENASSIQLTFTATVTDNDNNSSSDSVIITVNADENDTTMFTVNIISSNNGVVSDGQSINCGTACSAEYQSDALVSLSATVESGYRFDHWEGDVCDGLSNATCTFAITQNVTVTPIFQLVDTTLFTVNVISSDNGVVSDGQSINCGTACSAEYQSDALVSLSAAVDSGYRFDHWEGDVCNNSSSANCEFTITANVSIQAFFLPLENECGQMSILCVDDTNGAQQEYSTIQSAINDASAGDTVLVFSGTYVGFNINKSGTENNRLTVASNDENVFVTRRGTSSDAIIRISNANYVTLEGFTVNNQDNTGYGIAARGATVSNPMRGLVVKNNKVFDSPSTNIYLSQVSESTIEGNIAANSVDSHGIYLANGGSDNTILRANICYDNGRNGIHFNGDLSVGSGSTDGLHTGIIMEQNIIYENIANGVDMDGVQSSIIRNNLIYANGRHALRGFRIDSSEGPKALHIYNNTLVANGGWSIK